MTEHETKKKVRIQIDNQIHQSIIAEEEEYQSKKLVPYSKIPTIMHIKDLNAFQYRPNSDIDGDCTAPQDLSDQNMNLVYEHLDRWKKDLSLKTAQNADELKRMKMNHENSLKFNQKFPQINVEIIDAINRDPNEKYNQQYQSDATINNSQMSYQNHSQKGSQSDYKHLNNLSSQSMTQFGNTETSNLADKSKFNDSHNRIYTSSGNKSVKFIQSNESIQREVNKKLVNNLIFSRIQRTLEDNQITGNRNKGNRNEDSNKINKQRAEDIFKTEMSHFQNNTLANFKNLMYSFRRSNNLIEYEDLSRQLQTFLNRPTGIFDSSDQKNELLQSFKDEKEERYHQKHMERILLDNYKQLRDEITKRVNQIKDMRQYGNDLQNQLTNLNEKTRLYALQIEKDIEAQEKLTESLKKQTAAQITKMKKAVQKIQEDKEEQLQQFKSQRDQLISLCNQNSESLIIYEKEIKNHKEKKNITRNMLKQLYFLILKSDRSLQQQSLVWIVRALLNINEDVSQSDIFPSILDKQSIQYLVEYAALESNLDHIQNNMKQKLDDPESQQNNDKFDRTYLSKQHMYSISDLKEKVQKIAKKQNLKIRKPIFTTDQGKDYVLAWENAQDIKINEEITFSLAKVPPSKLDLINSNKNAREEIKQIKMQQKKMKEAESNRLIDQYLVYKDEKQINELKQIMFILFGETEGEEFYKNFQKKYMHLQSQIKNNKTFTFTRSNLTTKHQTETTQQSQLPANAQHFTSQTIFKYRKGIDEDENKQIDQFKLVKQVGKTFHKNKQDTNQTHLIQRRIELPSDVLERHNLMKKQVAENSDNYFNKKLLLTPQSLPNLDNYTFSKTNSSFNRPNLQFKSYGNLPPSLTNLSTESPLLKESQTQRGQSGNTLYFITQKMSTYNEFESPVKSSSSLGLLKQSNSNKKFIQQ